jgi:2-oxoglutarate dehydrogenase E2 component (dihydrolipoamide succinyltransferase)
MDNTLEIKVPVLPESVSDAVVISWYKKIGDYIERDEPIVDIETDKVVLEIPSPVSGFLKEIIEPDGSTVIGLQVLGILTETQEKKQSDDKAINSSSELTTPKTPSDHQESPFISPSAKKMIIENNLNSSAIVGTGKDGRILKEDVVKLIEQQSQKNLTQDTVPDSASVEHQPDTTAVQDDTPLTHREDKRVPMTRLRTRIAQRLLDAQQNAAILTTFNEVDMKPVMDLRKRYKELFEKKHDVKLGFMSFFVKAAVEALKQFPAVNASIDADDIVYHGYFDIGVAVSSPRGLVVPVLKNAESLSMANIEQTIKQLAIKARDNKLSLDEITGGTFSITNGGVFGSLLSTPILNPPQSAILGMHKIQDRPVVENGEIVIRPIMYLALSYDHRIIDGREAVQFLVTIKNFIEDPSRLLLEV